MDSSIIVSSISAAAAIISVVMTYYFTKRKEREAEWRKNKLDHYKELMSAMNDTLVSPLPAGAKIRFCNASNNIFLVGSPDVFIALRDLLEETSRPVGLREPDVHDKLLTDLLYAIREDIGINPNKPKNDFVFMLRSGHPLRQESEN